MVKDREAWHAAVHGVTKIGNYQLPTSQQNRSKLIWSTQEQKNTTEYTSYGMQMFFQENQKSTVGKYLCVPEYERA